MSYFQICWNTRKKYKKDTEVSVGIKFGKVAFKLKKGCVIKQTVANKKKIDIDLALFWGNSTIKYMIWCPDYLHNTDGRRCYNTLQKCGCWFKKT